MLRLRFCVVFHARAVASTRVLIRVANSSHSHRLLIAMSLSKRRKLEGDASHALVSLGKSAFVSKSGIDKLLATVKDTGLPDAFSRSSQYRARKQVCNTETRFGKLVVQDPATGLAFQNPLAFLAYHAEHSPHYADIVKNALLVHPCGPATPWTIVLYQDGVDPSDGLAKSICSDPMFVLLFRPSMLANATCASTSIWNRFLFDLGAHSRLSPKTLVETATIHA